MAAVLWQRMTWDSLCRLARRWRGRSVVYPSDTRCSADRSYHIVHEPETRNRPVKMLYEWKIKKNHYNYMYTTLFFVSIVFQHDVRAARTPQVVPIGRWRHQVDEPTLVLTATYWGYEPAKLQVWPQGRSHTFIITARWDLLATGMHVHNQSKFQYTSL